MGDVEVGALVNSVHHSLAEVDVENAGDTIRDVEVEALAYRLAEVKAEKVG